MESFSADGVIAIGDALVEALSLIKSNEEQFGLAFMQGQNASLKGRALLGC